MRKAVSEIFIVPPTGGCEIDRADLKAYMQRFFPRYQFHVRDLSACEDDDSFVLIPVAGVAGDGPHTGMFTPVPAGEWEQMHDALRSYGKRPALHS